MGCLTAKASGEIASFISPTVTPIESARVYFSPTQLGEGTPSPENVREIVERTSVELTHTGINLLGGDLLLENAKKHLPLMPGINTEEGTFWVRTGDTVDTHYSFSTGVKFKPNVRYTFVITLYKPSGTGANLRIYYTDGTYQQLTVYVHEEKTTICAVSKANKTVSYLRKTNGSAWTQIYYRECGVFEGVHTIDEYEDGIPPYRGNTFSVDWSDEIGTIYGGYVDLIKGEIVQTMVCYDLGDFDWAKADKEFRTTQATTAKAPSRQNAVLSSTLCNAYPIIPANKTDAGVHQQYDGIAINTDKHIWGYDTDLFNGTAEEYKQAMTGIKIVCERNTPIIHPLPDYLKTQLQTLKNENYFWSNADSVEIEYGLAETFDIQKAKRKIIMNQPHIETLTGDIVSFTTDMKAPLKECKVSFMPVQEGEGDPSPSNVRNIVGWNGIKIQFYNPITNLYVAKEQTISVFGLAFHVSEQNQNITINGTVSGVEGRRLNLFAIDGDNSTIFCSGFPKLTGKSSWSLLLDNDIITDSLQDINGFSYQVETNKKLRFGIKIYSGEVLSLDIHPIITKTSPISIDFNNTFYGGYVDLMSGELVDEYYSVPYTAWSVYKQNNGYICYKAVQPTQLGDWYCNVLNTYGSFSSNAMDKNIIQKHGTTLDSTGTLYMALDENVDISTVQVIYKRAVSVPIHYQLTPQQLITLKGQNNLWTNTNGTIDVKYWKH